MRRAPTPLLAFLHLSGGASHALPFMVPPPRYLFTPSARHTCPARSAGAEDYGAEEARWWDRGGGAASMVCCCGVAVRQKYHFSGDEGPAGAYHDRPVDVEQLPKEHCQNACHVLNRT